MMPAVDRTELDELRRIARGAEEDKAALRNAVAAAKALIVEQQRQLEEITAHRNRLLEEKAVAWGAVLAPDTIASEVTAADPAPDPAQLPLLEDAPDLGC